MAHVELGQVWEIYSANGKQWVPAVIAKTDQDTVTLRYQGMMEFVTVDTADLQRKPDVYRQVELAAR
jgi:hypothetical protein